MNDKSISTQIKEGVLNTIGLASTQPTTQPIPKTTKDFIPQQHQHQCCVNAKPKGRNFPVLKQLPKVNTGRNSRDRELFERENIAIQKKLSVLSKRIAENTRKDNALQRQVEMQGKAILRERNWVEKRMLEFVKKNEQSFKNLSATMRHKLMSEQRQQLIKAAKVLGKRQKKIMANQRNLNEKLNNKPENYGIAYGTKPARSVQSNLPWQNILNSSADVQAPRTQPTVMQAPRTPLLKRINKPSLKIRRNVFGTKTRAERRNLTFGERLLRSTPQGMAIRSAVAIGQGLKRINKPSLKIRKNVFGTKTRAERRNLTLGERLLRSTPQGMAIRSTVAIGKGLKSVGKKLFRRRRR